ncbi:MAG TPA: trimeric intracellular cation channel family protein [Chloroflexi bacterium]|nr:trimeric intracellular cation channel family protein [Chloroflexota bacterium]
MPEVLQPIQDLINLQETRAALLEQPPFQVPFLLDYLAVFLWAVSGAIVGMHKRYDFAGVLVVAILASTGGSLIRDGIFLQQTPPVLSDPWYIPVIIVATAFVGLFRRRITEMLLVDRVVDVIDGIGVPAFAIVGLQLSLQAGIPLPGVVVVGVTNGVGGGILRDLLVGDTPSALKPGTIFVSGVILICVLFLILTYGFGASKEWSAWAMIVLFFTIRMLSIRYNWRTRPVLKEPPSRD